MDTSLREHRQHRQLSTSALARSVGVHPNSVMRWERRERLPGPLHIQGLARSLQLETAEVARFFDAARRPDPTPLTSLRGHGLRPLRRAAQVPAGRVAATLGLSVSHVYNWEAGRVRIPERHLAGLSDLLGLPPDRLRRLLELAPVPDAVGARPPATELRRLRRRTGLSKEQVARRIGVGRHTLGAWERSTQRPGLGAVRRLAGVYGVPVAVLARACGVAAPPLLDPAAWRAGDLAEALAVLRRWSGLTQRQVAQRCGCSSSSVRAWERGRGVPRTSSRRSLEQAYGLGRDALLAAYPEAVSDNQENRQTSAAE